MATATQQNQQSQQTETKKNPIWKVLILFVLIAVLAAAGLAYQQYQKFISEPISALQQPVIIYIEPGSSLNRVASELQQQNLIKQPKWLVWYMRYQQKQHVVKAGEFMIDPAWTVDQLIDGLENPKPVQYPVTIVAGHTIEQTLIMIQQLPKIKIELDISDVESLQKLFKVDKKINDKYLYANIEGLILPETYHYQLGDSDKDILIRAMQSANQTLTTAWQNREKKLPYKTAYEALIMASIVEKETGYAPERPLIAGVFVRRLNKRMRLQTDPTVIYGIGRDYDGNIRKRDLLAKTPYNTYTINGLPPTPIALPSKEAIEAVMHPAKTKALYFVAKGGGQHHFSNTLVEHNRAVRKYILNKN